MADQPTQVIVRSPGSVLDHEAWLNQMADQGWLITTLWGTRHTFAAAAPGAWRVHVEPCVRTANRHRILGPVSAITLANDPGTHVVSSAAGRLIAVCPAAADPSDRVHPLGRAEGYRALARTSRSEVLMCLALLIAVLVAVTLSLAAARPLPLPTVLFSSVMTGLLCGLLLLIATTPWRILAAARDRLCVPSPWPEPTHAVRGSRLTDVARAEWLNDQAARGWAVISFDGRDEYTFEPSQPGQYQIAVEAIGSGFIAPYLIGSAPDSNWVAPGEMLTTLPDAEIVGASSTWVIARRVAQASPFTPPGRPADIAQAYAAAADRTHRAIPRTAVVTVLVAVLVLLYLAFVWFPWSRSTGVSGGTSVLAPLLFFQLAMTIRQWGKLARRAGALRAWADRYFRLADARM